MKVLYFLLLAAAAVCFLLEALRPGRPVVGRGGTLVPLGLLFWVLVPLIAEARLL